MRKLILLTLLLTAINAFAQKESETEKRLQDKYMQFLKEEGFSPSIDADGDVQFKKEGTIYYLIPSPDNNYFKLARYLNNEDKVQDLKIHKAMNATNAEYKAIRVFATSSYSGIWIEVACYLPEEDGFKAIFHRSLNTVVDAVTFFKHEYNKKDE